MEISSVRWLSEMGIEDPSFIQQCDLNSLDQFTNQQITAALGEDFKHTFSSESYSYPNFNPRSNNNNTFNCSSMEASHPCVERPIKLLKTNSWNSHNTEPAASSPDASSPNFLSFCNQNSPRTSTIPADILISQGSFMDQSYVTKAGQGSKRVNLASKPPSHTQDHIIAERKRREKLSQRFIALSAIVPGLKKMDKASVLGDAVKYVKQLQDRVKTLEDQMVKKTVESVVFIKKSHLSVDDDTSSTDENFHDRSDEPLPEIEARVSDKNILIRIHCEKQKGVLVKTLSEIEKLKLSVLNTSVMPFVDSALDITVIAQMDEEFSMTVKDLVRSLRSALIQFM